MIAGPVLIIIVVVVDADCSGIRNNLIHLLAVDHTCPRKCKKIMSLRQVHLPQKSCRLVGFGFQGLPDFPAREEGGLYLSALLAEWSNSHCASSGEIRLSIFSVRV
jgi:hypothetical protein